MVAGTAAAAAAASRMPAEGEMQPGIGHWDSDYRLEAKGLDGLAGPCFAKA